MRVELKYFRAGNPSIVNRTGLEFWSGPTHTWMVLRTIASSSRVEKLVSLKMYAQDRPTIQKFSDIKELLRESRNKNSA